MDLYIDADPAAMAKVWLGDITFDAARRSGAVRLNGPLERKRAFPSWLMLSKFAAVPSVHAASGSARGAMADAKSLYPCPRCPLPPAHLVPPRRGAHTPPQCTRSPCVP